MANIVVSRWRKHRMELLDGLGQHLAAQNVDHLALTGDVGNVALVGEWRAGIKWLQTYAGVPSQTTVIPGNHDAYVKDVVRAAAFEKEFAAYQTADAPSEGAPERALGGDSRQAYPFVRFRGPLALVAVNTCVPTGDLGAWGDIGSEQLLRVERALQSEAVKQKIRVVLMHHPPVLHRAGENRNLKDRDAFVDMLSRAGADLVLHGHDHRDLSATLQGPGGRRVFVVGAGSASYAGKPSARARYNVYEFSGSTITCVTYAHDEQSNGFEVAKRWELV